jgi:hypothetical protein
MRFFILSALQYEAFPAYQHVVANKKYLDTGLVLILGEGNNILFTSYGSGDSLPFNDTVCRLNLVSEQGSLFKIQSLGGFLHIALKLPEHSILLAFKEKDYFLYYFVIFSPAYGTGTGSQTVSDVVLEAGPPVNTGNGFGTGAEGEDSF